MPKDIKVLIVTIPEKGHVNPLIGVAKELSSKGITINFFSQTDISEQLEKAGLTCQSFTPDAGEFVMPKEHASRGKDFAEKLKDGPWLRRWIKRLLLDVVPSQIDPLRKLVKEVKPDVIITDPMVYSSVIVAHTENIPWVGISSSLNPVTPDSWRCELVDTLQELQHERELLLSEYGITPSFKVSDAISPWLNIVLTTEEYVSRSSENNDFVFCVGPSIPEGQRGDETEFPFHKLRDDCKKVYMSLGSQVYYHPDLFKTVSSALPDDDIQLIFSVSDLYYEDFVSELPQNVIVVPYTPQLKVLENVDLMISHGGANSVMESLYNSVPIALLPLCNDQFLQAKFIENSGVGIVLDSENPDVNEYRQKLLPLLAQDSKYKERAKVVGDSYRKCNGAKNASDLIIKLAKDKKPLTKAYPLGDDE